MIASPAAVVSRGPRSYTSVMPIPEFLRALRERIGHDHLMLPAVAMAVPDEHGRVLVMRRADDGSWSLPSGILEPGEDPAHGAARELFEETGLVASVEALLCIFKTPPIVHPNGDCASYVSTLFRCRVRGGGLEARDGEALDFAWRALDDLSDIAVCAWLPRPLAELLDAPGGFVWHDRWLAELR
jgi:8-oxo-dGTP pyrophosphatase MutT (NUDIX family)